MFQWIGQTDHRLIRVSSGLTIDLVWPVNKSSTPLKLIQWGLVGAVTKNRSWRSKYRIKDFTIKYGP